MTPSLVPSPPTVRLLPLTELAAFLPQLLARVSPTRAAIIGEQIRAAIVPQRESLVALVCNLANPQDTAVALLQHELGTDFATVLHVGLTDSSGTPGRQPWQQWFKESFGIVCKNRGIEFLQWATDPIDCEKSADHAATELGFRWLGTLDYLARDFSIPEQPPINDPLTINGPLLSTFQGQGLRWKPIDQNDPIEVARFESIVHQTYQDSHDCPGLESMRSVHQILMGYRVAASYWPEAWFIVHDDCSSDGSPNGSSDDPVTNIVGCVILAQHDDQTVTELTYMGVVPAQRGQGHGEAIFCQTIAECKRRRMRRLILAVDRINHFAGALYRRNAMLPILSETIWGWVPER